MNSDDGIKVSEAPISSAPEQRVSDPPAPPSISVEPRVGESVWRGVAVKVFLLILLLAAVFALGHWRGRNRAMHQDGGADSGAAAQEAPVDDVLYWTCSMHPQVKLPKFGQCPICFMDLVPVRAGGDDPDAPKLTLSKRARELARVQTAVVQRRELTHEVRMVGKVAADETRITYVSSYIPGRLDRLFVNYTGIMVRKGDHLAEIYSPDLLVAQREYLLALETAERRRTEATTAQPSNDLLESAKRKLELWGVSKDVLDTLARERRPSDHIRIDSPLEGWVLERQGFQGMYVETGTRLFTLADLRSVWVLLDAYELDLGFLRLAQEVEFETEAYPGRVFKGRVSYIDPVLRPDTRTVKVRVNVENSELKLRPEMFVRARLNVRVGEGGEVVDSALAGKWICYMHPEVVKDGPGQCDICGMDLVKAESLGHVATTQPVAGALAVPEAAVLLTGKRAVVYVENKEGDETRYEGRVVRLGPRAGSFYIVEEGLQEGERVATRGALLIDSALQIQAKPSMMQPREGDETVAETQPGEEPAIVVRYAPGAMYHQHVAPVIDAYLELVETLAGDDGAGAVAAVKKLRDTLERAEPHGLKAEDAEAFTLLISALSGSLPPEEPAIGEIRDKLPALTKALQTYLKTFGHSRPAPLFDLFCPMAFNNKGASWLQADEKVSNPYFGKKMLRCGDVRGQIPAQPVGEHSATASTNGRSAQTAPAIVPRYVSKAMYHEHVAPAVDAYLELVRALAADDAAGAGAAVGRLQQGLKGAQPHGLEAQSADEFKQQISSIQASLPAAGAGIGVIRERLPMLTQTLETYVKTFGHTRSEPIVEMFCPMAFDDKGAAWLQSGTQVNNPYFGRKMLRCGEVRARISADGKVLQ